MGRRQPVPHGDRELPTLAALEAELATRRVGWVPLVPGEPGAGVEAVRDPRWHVVVNVGPEAD